MTWSQAGRMLKGLRESRGWELARVAAELEAQAGAIGRSLPNRAALVRMLYDWESGAHRPRDYYVLFILIYATQPELAARSIERGSELDRLMTALKLMGVPVNRRKFLLNSAALAAGTTSGPAVAANADSADRLAWVLQHPRSVDLATATHLRQTALDLFKRNEATPATTLLPRATKHLADVTFLRANTPKGQVRRALSVVEAQSATLMGRLVWDVSGQRDHAAAEHYYRQAIAAADQAQQGWAAALPRLFLGFLNLYGYGRRADGLTVATEAARLAGDGSSHILTAWSSGLVGVANARLGQEHAAKAALASADAAIREVDAGDPLFGVFTAEELGGYTGACLYYLGDPTGAARAWRYTASSLGLGFEKNKAVVLGDVAKAYIRQREPEPACATLHQSIDLIELTRHAGALRRVFKAGWQLRPWRTEPFVQDVQDRLLALGCAIPPQ